MMNQSDFLKILKQNVPFPYWDHHTKKSSHSILWLEGQCCFVEESIGSCPLVWGPMTTCERAIFSFSSIIAMARLPTLLLLPVVTLIRPDEVHIPRETDPTTSTTTSTRSVTSTRLHAFQLWLQRLFCEFLRISDSPSTNLSSWSNLFSYMKFKSKAMSTLTLTQP